VLKVLLQVHFQVHLQILLQDCWFRVSLEGCMNWRLTVAHMNWRVMLVDHMSLMEKLRLKLTKTVLCVGCS